MIYFTSDTHFFHENVIKYSNRPYKDAAHMNEVLVSNWNTVVLPDDTIYVLGDFSLAAKAVTEILPRLNGNKHLIMGNHDHCHPLHYRKKLEKGARMRDLYHAQGFQTIQLERDIVIGDQIVKMHHMPYVGDHTQDVRYADWRPKDNGGWLLHGHIHDLWKIKGKQINVGVDVWDYKPVSIEEIEKIIKG